MSILHGISNNLNILMEKMHISANKLARETGIPPSTIKKIRSMEQANPTISTLAPIAAYFGLTLEQFISGDVLDNLNNIKSQQKNIPCARTANPIPLIAWENILERHDREETPEHIYSEHVYSKNSFSSKTPDDEIALFPKNTILIIEPHARAVSKDFVLVSKQDSREVQLKQYLCEDNTAYLKSLSLHAHIIPVLPVHQFIGVVMEFKKQFKIFMPDNKTYL